MELAILIFFVAIFTGVLFLAALIWFVFRLLRKRRPEQRGFTGGNTSAAIGVDDDRDDYYIHDDAVAESGFAPYEEPAVTSVTENVVVAAASHEHTPVYDSGSSADSGSSFDSGSSYDSGSSDSGSSSSSTD